MMTEVNDKYFTLFNEASDGIVFMDVEGKISDVNPGLCRLVGYSDKELVGMNIADITDPIQLKIDPLVLGTIPLGESVTRERRLLKKDGSKVEWEINIKRVTEDLFLGIGRNINGIRLEQKKIALNEFNFKSVFDYSAIGMLIVSTEGKILKVNKKFSEITGYTEDELLKMSFFDITHPDDIETGLTIVKNAVEGKFVTYAVEKRYIHKSRKIIWVNITTSVVYDAMGNLAYFVTQVEDITGRIEEERKINNAVLNAQENERLQIGMELHDNVKQMLVASGLFMNIALDQLEGKAVLTNILNSLKKYNKEAVDELRRLSHQLAPLVESETTLNEKIDWLIQSLKLQENFAVSVNVDEFENSLNNETQLSFYRILQEQLTNILKYSAATAIEINVLNSGKEIRLQIKDNGNGFDMTMKKEGIGLENIHRRAQMLNGKMEIITSPGNGFELNVIIPFS